MAAWVVFPKKEDGIQVLAGLMPSIQPERSLLRTPWPGSPPGKIQQKECSMNSFHWKNASLSSLV